MFYKKKKYQNEKILHAIGSNVHENTLQKALKTYNEKYHTTYTVILIKKKSEKKKV